MIEPLSDPRHIASTSEETVILDEIWNDTGDEQALGVPCSPNSGIIDFVGRQAPPRKSSPGTCHMSNATVELSPSPSPSPGRLRDGWSRRGAERNVGHAKPSAELHGGIRGSHRQHNLWKQHRVPDMGASWYDFSPDKSLGHLGVGARGRSSLRELQEVEEKHAKNYATGCSGVLEDPYDLRGQGNGQSGNGGGEWCLEGAVVQGYCNWLLDENVTRVRWSPCRQGSERKRHVRRLDGRGSQTDIHDPHG